MWDTIKAIWAGFTGKLDHYPEARKLVWMLTLVFLAGWAATAFAAWISFKSYFSIIGAWMPGATFIAWFITITIACVMYYGLGYLSGYLVEIWKKVPKDRRDYTVLGARLMFVFCVAFGFLDFNMNLQGGKEIIHESAGTVSAPDYMTITAPTQSGISTDQKRLDDLMAGRLGGYGWRDPKTKIYHLNDSGKRLEKSLMASIARQQEFINATATTATDQYHVQKAEREQYLQKNTRIVTFLVYFIYGIMGLLTLVQAYCTETIQLAAGTNGREGFHAPAPATTAAPVYEQQQNAAVGFEWGGRTAQNPVTHRVQDAAMTRYSVTGYACTCVQCGTQYMAKRPPRPDQLTFCCADHRMQYHGERLRQTRAAAKG